MNINGGKRLKSLIIMPRVICMRYEKSISQKFGRCQSVAPYILWLLSNINGNNILPAVTSSRDFRILSNKQPVYETRASAIGKINRNYHI